jgi:hypothetical protein
MESAVRSEFTAWYSKKASVSPKDSPPRVLKIKEINGHETEWRTANGCGGAYSGV